MKIPNRIQPLVDDGLVDDVISRLMSGKEADVYVVRGAPDAAALRLMIAGPASSISGRRASRS